MTIALILLWAVVIALGIVVLALARQVGILFERVAPMGALMTDAGPKIGEASPRFDAAGAGRQAASRSAAARAQPRWSSSCRRPARSARSCCRCCKSCAEPKRSGSTSCWPATASAASTRPSRQAAGLDDFPYVLSTRSRHGLPRQPPALSRSCSTSAGIDARQGPDQLARAAGKPVQRQGTGRQPRSRTILGAGQQPTHSRRSLS